MPNRVGERSHRFLFYTLWGVASRAFKKRARLTSNNTDWKKYNSNLSLDKRLLTQFIRIGPP